MKRRHTFLIVFFITLLIILSLIHINVLQKSTEDLQQLIFWEFKVPRLLSALLAGAGLSISGLLMQNLFQNPMAGPYVLGINSAASLFIAIMVLGVAPSFWGVFSYVGAAMCGAFISASLMFVVSRRVQNLQSLLVIGLMFASFMGAFESILQSFASPEQVKQIYIWNMGSLQQLSADQVPWFMFFVLAGISLCFPVIKALNAFVLGELHAAQLGISVKKIRIILLLIAALLAGSITAFCGPIAFVGLAIPNLTRALLKTQDHLILILFTALIGSIFLLVVDSMILILDPWISLPLNVLTAGLGAPYVAYLMLKSK